jgi:hypothetical protein
MSEPTYDHIEHYDRILGNLHGLPDVTTAGPSTVRTVQPLIGGAQTFIVTTYRQTDRGDTVFLESISAEGGMRFVIPPAVTAAIARQREALTTKVRRRVGRASAQARKDRGEAPAFMKTARAKRKRAR